MGSYKWGYIGPLVWVVTIAILLMTLPYLYLTVNLQVRFKGFGAQTFTCWE